MQYICAPIQYYELLIKVCGPITHEACGLLTTTGFLIRRYDTFCSSEDHQNNIRSSIANHLFFLFLEIPVLAYEVLNSLNTYLCTTLLLMNFDNYNESMISISDGNRIISI